ncbi:hypothetical protein Gotur_027787 [Gossypium turneri]
MDEEEDPLVVVGDDMSADPEYGLCLVGIEYNMGQIEGRGDEVELKDMPIEFVDRKKRKRFNLEVGGFDNKRGLLEGGLENVISVAATEQAD